MCISFLSSADTIPGTSYVIDTCIRDISSLNINHFATYVHFIYTGQGRIDISAKRMKSESAKVLSNTFCKHFDSSLQLQEYPFQ